MSDSDMVEVQVLLAALAEDERKVAALLDGFNWSECSALDDACREILVLLGVRMRQLIDERTQPALCPCGKPAAHINAPADSEEWACRVPEPVAVPFVAIGAGEEAPWAGLDLNCPTCGTGPLELQEGDPVFKDTPHSLVLRYISHCGQTWMRGSVKP